MSEEDKHQEAVREYEVWLAERQRPFREFQDAWRNLLLQVFGPLCEWVASLLEKARGK